MPAATDNPRAAALFTAATCALTLSDSIVKALAGVLTVPQILLFRGIALALVYPLLFRGLGMTVTRAGLANRLNLLRGAVEALISLAYFTALQHLPLATAMALFFTTPVFGTLLGVLLLGEKVGPRRWSAVLVGLVGVVVFLGLDGIAWRWAVLLPLMTAALVAVRDALTRAMPAEVSSATITVTTALATGLSGALAAPFAWLPPDGPSMLAVAAIIVISGTAFWLYITATRLGEISFLAPFRYLGLPLGALVGFLGWGEVPLAREWAGAALIVGSGLFIVFREHQLARATGA